MMRRYFGFLVIVLALVTAPRGAAVAAPRGHDDAVREVGRVLDAWHAAAARADETAYFSHFAAGAVFMGTDATERWTVEEFRAYAHPYFEKGKAWTFRADSRHVSVAPDERTAWFDESLVTGNMGMCRGSGVVVLVEGAWRIAQYNLSIPIPNELVKDFVARIAEHGKAASDPGAAANEVRVISFNIRYDNQGDKEDRWEGRRDKVASFIRAESPDVVGLQEALHGQLEFLKAELPGMGAIGVGRDDGQTHGEYAAILYRADRWRVAESGTFWFSDTPDEPGTKNWGNRIVRICTWARFVPRGDDGAGGVGEAGGGFYLYNLHLDHESQASREKSVALLMQRIGARAHLDPVVVTGDFNAGEGNAAVLAMKGEAPPAAVEAGDGDRLRFVDAFRVMHPDEKVVGTFNSFRGTQDGDKIDYIFVEPGMRVKAAAIHRERPEGRDLSDHFPVSATVVLPSKER